MSATKTATREKMIELLDRLAGGRRLIAPTLRNGIVAFAEIARGNEVVFDFPNSREPPKKIFFPESETLFSFDKDGKRHVPRQDDRETIVFGARPCDARSLTLLDKVFDGPDYSDPYYAARRENATIVGLACNAPRNTCFCSSFGIGPFSKIGSDVLVSDLGDLFLIESVTEKGDALLREMPEFNEATGRDTQRALELQSIAEKKIGRRIETAGVAEKLDAMFDHPLWSRIHERCVGCGICSFLCPTCHCFDVSDTAVGKGGRRIRTWDCCMFASFTKEASGHNPRQTGKERMRQRVMHKFNYFVKNHGTVACVGCGRCMRNCPVGGDITKVIETIMKSGIKTDER